MTPEMLLRGLPSHRSGLTCDELTIACTMRSIDLPRTANRLTAIAISIVAILGLTGCDAAKTRILSAADATRTATERAAAAARSASDAREAQIAEEALPYHQAEAIALGERYYLEAEGAGWTVMDRVTNSPVSRGGEGLQDMSLEAAQDAVDELREAEATQ
jgi:hypothetical protein